MVDFITEESAGSKTKYYLPENDVSCQLLIDENKVKELVSHCNLVIIISRSVLFKSKLSRLQIMVSESQKKRLKTRKLNNLYKSIKGSFYLTISIHEF